MAPNANYLGSNSNLCIPVIKFWEPAKVNLFTPFQISKVEFQKMFWNQASA